MNNQHVVPHSSGGWAVVREGKDQASLVFKNKPEATKKAKEIARNNHSEVFIHNRNGQIRVRNSFVSEKVNLKKRK